MSQYSANVLFSYTWTPWSYFPVSLGLSNASLIIYLELNSCLFSHTNVIQDYPNTPWIPKTIFAQSCHHSIFHNITVPRMYLIRKYQGALVTVQRRFGLHQLQLPALGANSGSPGCFHWISIPFVHIPSDLKAVYLLSIVSPSRVYIVHRISKLCIHSPSDLRPVYA